jgi:hypothetical protein
VFFLFVGQELEAVGGLDGNSYGYYNWLNSRPSKRWLKNQTISKHIKNIY